MPFETRAADIAHAAAVGWSDRVAKLEAMTDKEWELMVDGAEEKLAKRRVSHGANLAASWVK